MAAGMTSYSGVYILIYVMSLYFYCQEYICRSNCKGPADFLPDEQKCRHENQIQISGRLTVGQTRAAKHSNPFGSRNGVGRRGPRCNMTAVDFKTFTFSAGSESRSIDHAVFGPLPKILLFTMIKNTDFNGSVDTNPYKFRHYISEFSLYFNGRRVTSEGLSLEMDHGKRLSWAIAQSLNGPAIITRTRVYR